MEYTTALLGTKDSKIEKREETKNERKQKVKNHGIPKHRNGNFRLFGLHETFKKMFSSKQAEENSRAERCREMGK